MSLLEEGIHQTREGSEIFEWLGDTVKEAECLFRFAYALCSDNQLDAAEEAASRTGTRRTISSGLGRSPRSWQYILLQGRCGEGHPPGSPRNRVLSLPG